MLKDGFLRFCDDPEIACCKAETELGQLRQENAHLLIQLQKAQRRERAAVEEIIRIITNESRCDLCGRLLGNGDCEIYSDEEERCEPIPRYMRRGVERDKALARLEAEVGVALGKGCDYCGLIYAIHAESYGIEDLDCANEPIDNKFCPMCGKRLEAPNE